MKREELNEEIQQAFKILAELTTPGGCVLSSKTGHYHSVWIRDNLFCTFALEYSGRIEESARITRQMFDIVYGYKETILQVVNAPDPFALSHFLPCRFEQDDLRELSQETGYLHLDYPGMLLFKVGQLTSQGQEIIDPNSPEEIEFLQTLIRYLEILEYPTTLEFGLWEEGPEVHASTLMLVLAGLESARTAFPELKTDARLAKAARDKLDQYWPEESVTRPVDVCQLVGYWPLGWLTFERASELVKNIEGSLVKRRGVIRYPEDAYYNPRPDSPRGTEPRWPLGFAWLAITFFQMAAWLESAPDEERPGDANAGQLRERGWHYLNKCREQKVFGTGHLPELISGGDPNINTPFSWAESFYALACLLARDSLPPEPEKKSAEK